MPDAQSWVPDILGEPYEQLTLELGDDAEGPVVATLVRAGVPASSAPLADVDVLYVHGWSDYFFQTALADFWTDLGARFFALDLRKYGRSLREGQTPGYVASLGEYDDDIILTLVGGDEDDETDAASSLMIMAMGAEHGDQVTVTSDNDEAVEKIAALIESNLDDE